MKLQETLTYEPQELSFGTSGLRGLVTDMTDLECYINTKAFLAFVQQDTDHPVRTVYIAGDLRESTPRIMQSVAQAIIDCGLEYENCGLIPTPALAYYAEAHGQPGIMVTGSHIPADRNGIKFYKAVGEALKSDEVAIKEAVRNTREEIYNSVPGKFDPTGSLVNPRKLIQPSEQAREFYITRYTAAFSDKPLNGKIIVMYQHSAVGRDLIPLVLEKLGASVIREGRSEVFVPIDSENVTKADEEYFKSLAAKHSNNFAIISTDGDSDRPFVIDETGIFHSGDVLGLPTTQYLGIGAVAFPISSNDAVTQYLNNSGITYRTTRIGSPYVIEAMQGLSSSASKVASWEVNGGYLLGSDISMPNGAVLKALPTRDALLPIICALLLAIEKNMSVSQLFAEYPKRYTKAGLIDNFPQEASQKILQLLSEKEAAKQVMQEIINPEDHFGALEAVDTTDGVRMSFANNEVMHIRPSGNAPQLRTYSNADTQVRADYIVARSTQEPNGILRKLQKKVS